MIDAFRAAEPVLAWGLAAAMAGASAVMLAYWGAGFFRLVRTMRSEPTARAGIELARRRPLRQTVCIIVPAHNERRQVTPLIESLRAQRGVEVRVVLALDRCADGTADAARDAVGGDPRFEIIEIDRCPEGWSGKVNAIRAAAEASPSARTADLLLFADADTTIHPDCVAAAAAILRERGLALLSLLSTLRTRRWDERIVQPAAAVELVTQYPILRANRRHNPRPFANGQFLMVDRRAYESIGGHAAVKDELLEDLALARLASSRGMATGIFLADDLLTCGMYDSWSAFQQGWKRIFTESAKRRPRRLMRAARRVRNLGVFLPAACAAMVAWGLWRSAAAADTPQDAAAPWTFIHGLAPVLAALALLAMAATLTTALRIGRMPVWTIVAYPIGAWIIGGVLRSAARDLRHGRPTQWGGRQYIRPAR